MTVRLPILVRTKLEQCLGCLYRVFQLSCHVTTCILLVDSSHVILCSFAFRVWTEQASLYLLDRVATVHWRQWGNNGSRLGLGADPLFLHGPVFPESTVLKPSLNNFNIQTSLGHYFLLQFFGGVLLLAAWRITSYV